MEKPLTTAEVPPQFLKAVYMVGHVPSKALPSDPRVSYRLYIPPEKYKTSAENNHGSGLGKLLLLVYVHGTRRDTSALHGELAALAEATPCAVVAPLFPSGLDGPNDLDSYKLLRSATLRYDTALLSILDEAAQRWPGIRTDRVFLMGYSGGAQFALRFLYLHPERLASVSLGAPGLVMFLDDTQTWPVGTADVESLFGRTIDKDAIRGLEIQLVVGGADVTIPGGSREFWDWLGEMRARRGGTEAEVS
ncbi:Alpha/Beta hydrolase protein [Biscogniauxia marginata]|nr:Alpha/Beta hydrolase protein [Biscogniauxia marginata]